MPVLEFPNGLSYQKFLSEFWQKKPLLMRNGLRDYEYPLSPDELAGLSCEEDVESRLILQHSDESWELRHGPFDEDSFSRLPEDYWTLLVQDVDKYVPQVADLLQLFEFIPSWRVDDVMISYAEDGGSVGPHTDTYDVFLVQAMGKRLWQINTDDFSNAELLPDLSVRVLRDFFPRHEWVLEPGDVLYLPPGVAHWGIAQGECMTYSVGFRSPSEQEMVADFADYLMQHIPDRLHYADPALKLQAHPGEITEPVFDNISRALAQWLSNPALVKCWFGCFNTELKAHLIIDPPERLLKEDELSALIRENRSLVRHPYSRFAFALLGTERIQLFACGQYFELDADCYELIAMLCRTSSMGYMQLEPWLNTDAGSFLLQQLYNLGYLVFEDE